MKRPVLLFVSPRFLFPVDMGAKIRTTQVLRGLKGGPYEVVLASPTPAGWQQQYGDDIAAHCDRFRPWREPPFRELEWLWALRHTVGNLPVPVAKWRSGHGKSIVASELARRPAIVVFDFPHTVALASSVLPPGAVLFTHNVEVEFFEQYARRARNHVARYFWRRQARKMELFEGDVVRRFARVIAVSDRDRRQLESRYGARGVSVVRTGVDLDSFSYCGPAEAPRVLFVGAPTWRPNADGLGFFMNECWPTIAARHPGAEMTVVGRQSPASVLRFARASGSNWHFTGFVPDLRPYLERAAVFVVPLRIGSGTRLKVFQAMASGCPVVSTAVGVQGLPVVPGEHFLLADTPGAFAKAVVQLLEDGSLRRRLAERARAFVEARCSAADVVNDFLTICDAGVAAASSFHARNSRSRLMPSGLVVND